MNTFVMTGGTSGIGEIAARRLAGVPGARLLLGTRGAALPEAEAFPLDLARLDSVRAFAESIVSQVDGTRINGLVLNAGIATPDADSRTADGFETAFAVNHLAHYLLLRLLLPHLADGATVVLTTSSTHDPAAGTRMPPPRHADAPLLAHPDRDAERDRQPGTAGRRAYASSKLCNILTARALAAQPEARQRDLVVVAYDPGPTPGTGLMRNGPWALRLAWAALEPLRSLVPRFNGRVATGTVLADIVLGAIKPPSGRVYASFQRSHLGWPDPSQLAMSDDAMHALWRDSAALTGIPK
ncbi:SDR family NAD(P)-dependent oxidoreductase [Nocardia amamiensis]|uniref:SDR family NAD(P)-dependent oxidoreductase n=1 Tax=Nocardia amamiensis TaxID=404578 RepID=A0ABS0D464_9NOCA|nr:SDR family NAD(P)-dependent oxidoreductase [Nocardia amamiensis]MBF6302913.1 SDR family NAD(P)-dependent oxidoreductase [Nocardia amamiensis]